MSKFIFEKTEQPFSDINPEKDTQISKENLIDPESLLSSDLLKQINEIDDKNSFQKKESIDKNIQLDDAQKESEEIEEDEDENISEDEINLSNNIFNYQIFQNNNEENERNAEKKFKKNDFDNKVSIKTKQQSSQYLSTVNLNQNSFNSDISSFLNETRSFSSDYNIFQNRNNNAFNAQSMNDFNDLKTQLAFFNNSFSMNGRQGWVCTHCKNFNFESKLIIFLFFYTFFLIIFFCYS